MAGCTVPEDSQQRFQKNRQFLLKGFHLLQNNHFHICRWTAAKHEGYGKARFGRDGGQS